MKKYEKLEVAQYTQFRCRTTGSSRTSSSGKKSKTGTICIRKKIQFRHFKHVLSLIFFKVSHSKLSITDRSKYCNRQGQSADAEYSVESNWLNRSWTNILKHTSPEKKNSFRQSGLLKSSKKREQIQNTRPPLYSWSGILWRTRHMYSYAN